MGGKISKARRACTTDVSTSANIGTTNLSAEYTRSRKVDTECVKSLISSGGK
mgnify:CR=1 FL=1